MCVPVSLNVLKTLQQPLRVWGLLSMHIHAQSSKTQVSCLETVILKADQAGEFNKMKTEQSESRAKRTWGAFGQRFLSPPQKGQRKEEEVSWGTVSTALPFAVDIVFSFLNPAHSLS